MTDKDTSYNFDDDSFDDEIESPEIKNSTVKRAGSTQESNKLSLWEKIKPMILYYVIGIIALGVAGYMFKNAYKSLYPEKKVEKSQGSDFKFSSNDLNVKKQQPRIIKQQPEKREIKDNSVQQESSFDKQIDLTPVILKLESVTSKIERLTSIKDSSNADLLKFKKSIEDIKDDQKKLESLMINISNKVSSNNKNILSLKSIAKENSRKLKLMLANQYNNREKLKLRAIVTGRAWLVNKDGVTLTVTKGNKIPGYGKVEHIDDKENKVTMSSGYIFQ